MIGQVGAHRCHRDVAAQVDVGIAAGCGSDALIAAHPGALPFEHVQQHVDDVVLVSDEQAKGAIRALASTTKLVAEPGGAVSVAAAMAGVIDVRGKTAVSLISGGNISMSLLGEFLSCES